MLRILELRSAKAHLLGYRNFADLVLEERMAKNGERAFEFVRELHGRTQAYFHKENSELAGFSTTVRRCDHLRDAAVGHRLLRRKAARGALRLR